MSLKKVPNYVWIGLCLIIAAVIIFNIPALQSSNTEKTEIENSHELIFDEIDWGISKDEVIENMSGVIIEDDIEDQLAANDEYLELDVRKDYHFYDDQFSALSIHFTQEYDDPNDFIVDYENVKEHTETIYDEPESEHKGWMEGTVPRENLGQAVADGDLIYNNEWEEDEKTKIQHVLFGTHTLHGTSDDNVYHIIIFLSKELEDKMMVNMMQ